MAVKLNIKQAFSLLYEWAGTKIEFSGERMMGNGIWAYDKNHGLDYIEVGIYPMSKSFLAKYSTIDSSDFVKMGCTMFHELAHRKSRMTDNTPKEILISDLSKQGNPQYYRDNWHILPHEIDAEYTGIISMWEHLKQEYPEDANSLMIKRLEERTEQNKTYMFERPTKGFISKEQIDALFSKAYNESLTGKRILSGQFLRSDDLIAQTFIKDRSINQDYYPFYQQITKATGQNVDIMLASLVSYICPELQSAYSQFNFQDIKPDNIFGIKMPESREEILERIDMDAVLENMNMDYEENNEILDFTNAINSIKQTNSPEL